MKPLEGMTVLDLTRAIAGPYSTLFLADLGARVIKIENPNDPDIIRAFDPKFGEGDRRLSAAFAQYNRNKVGITLNLSNPEAQEIFKEMVKKADVVVENYRPGVMEKFGLNYDILRQENPRIIYAAISGYGQYGPYVKRPAYDSCAQAVSGLWSVNGFPDRPAVRVGTIISDLVAGLFGTIGILTAYQHAQKTGIGQLVDVAQLDASLAITGYAVPNYTVGGIVAAPLGNADSNARPFESFKTKDGYIFFGGFTDKFMKITFDFFGEPEFLENPEVDTMAKRLIISTYLEKVKPKMEECFARFTSAELENALADEVPIVPIKNIVEAIKDPQIQARDMMVNVPYPDCDVEIFGLPVKLSETPGDPKGMAPLVGEHNELVFGELMGFTKDKLAELKAKDVI